MSMRPVRPLVEIVAHVEVDDLAQDEAVGAVPDRDDLGHAALKRLTGASTTRGEPYPHPGRGGETGERELVDPGG